MTGGVAFNWHHERAAAKNHGVPWLLFSGLLAVVLGFGIGYILQMNRATTKGYEIRNLENSVVSLRAKNEKLTTELTTLRALQNIEGKIGILGFEKIDQVIFLKSLSGEVAVAR
ncbi:MAG: hypothetical protein V1821_01030 [bacterium]